MEIIHHFQGEVAVQAAFPEQASVDEAAEGAVATLGRLPRAVEEAEDEGVVVLGEVTAEESGRRSGYSRRRPSRSSLGGFLSLIHII